MHSVAEIRNRKNNVYRKTQEYFQTYTRYLIVSLDHITSIQLQNIKLDLRGKAKFLTGKNTTIKRALVDMKRTDVLEYIQENCAFIFVENDFAEVKQVLEANTRDSVAKVGDVSQCDWFIKPHITAMGPEKTSFFQALGINTKITKSFVEIISSCQMLFKGKKVMPSQANLLQIMNIKPFIYKMEILQVYDEGEFYSADLLNITEEDIAKSLTYCITESAQLSLGLGLINQATVPYNILSAYRDAIALGIGAGVDSEIFNKYK